MYRTLKTAFSVNRQTPDVWNKETAMSPLKMWKAYSETQANETTVGNKRVPKR